MNKLITTLIVSAGLTAGAPLAFAQAAPSPDAPQARTAPRGPGMHGHHAQRARMSAADRTEARLAYVRTALKITDAQQPQWDAFAGVLRKHAQQRDEFRKTRLEQGKPARAANAIERLERRQKFMTVASERMGEVLAAAKPLYASLSPEQQQIADGLIARQGHGARGHGRGMHHAGGHHGAMKRGA
jgi:hypothetical protein